MKTTDRLSRGEHGGVLTPNDPGWKFTSASLNPPTMQDGEGQAPDGETKQCAALWRSVIAQHIRDLATYGSALTPERTKHKAEAAQWMGFEGKTPLGSEGFFEVCELALVSPLPLLDVLGAIMGMNLSDAARCFKLHDLAMQINRGPLQDRFKPVPDSSQNT